MAATPITKSARYINAGITKCYFVPTIANPDSPTRVELDAGTDLTREVAEVSGWMVASEQVPAPDLDTTFTSQITGRSQAEDSAITFYADRTSVDVRDILPRDTEGYIVWLDGGDVASQKMDVFPARVASLGKTRTVEGEPARITVAFAVTSEPSENVVIPA